MTQVNPTYYIGQMSGTSLDGIDTVLMEIDLEGCEQSFKIAASLHTEFSPSLKTSILSLCQGTINELELCALVSNQLSQCYGDAVIELLTNHHIKPEQVTAIGCHGQTVRHIPPKYTVQLINGALLAELTSIDVVCDFRSRDMAAGGQGAPLVPAFHSALFNNSGNKSSIQQDLFVVNIGGMSNISYLPINGLVCGHDTGPGNILMDAWIQKHKKQPYDESGNWAKSGEVDTGLLRDLASDPYFSLPAPKSTGREHFNLGWLNRIIGHQISAENVQASLLQLTVNSIANEIEKLSTAGEIVVCGGGAFNQHLLSTMQLRLGGFKVMTSEDKGFDPQWIEAMAFAWLAQRCIERKTGNVAEVTGAKGKRILGAIYPA
ncbi:MAG: anhydro-N-acetylmuramic acid kinase [Bermanella sp.]|jgi:anhydro-N-acetylmuramic acid kinase